MELREIITPTSNAYVLNLPDEMVGKQVEVIAHEIENPAQVPDAAQNQKKIDEIRDIFKDCLIDLSNFKFDRDEANNYDE